MSKSRRAEHATLLFWSVRRVLNDDFINSSVTQQQHLVGMPEKNISCCR